MLLMCEVESPGWCVLLLEFTEDGDEFECVLEGITDEDDNVNCVVEYTTDDDGPSEVVEDAE